MKKKADAINTQERIINATYELLIEKGYANVFTRDIAESAGVALSQLNYYYKSKEKLFIVVIDKVVKTMLNELNAEFNVAKDREECLNRLVAYFQKIIDERRGIMMIIIDFTTQAMWQKSLQSNVKALFYDLNIMIQKYILKTEPTQTTLNGVPLSKLAETIIFTFIGLSMDVIIGKRESISTVGTGLIKFITRNDVFDAKASK